MTNAADGIKQNASIHLYFKRIAAGLQGIGETQKQEIVAEIRSHLDERVSELSAEGDADALDHALAALGDADDLAAQFVSEVRTRSGPRSYIPWTLLRRAAHIAGTGLRGFAAFLIGLVGYGTALAAIVAVAMKPFAPRVGLWVGNWGFVWGLPPAGAGGRELLGSHFAEATIVLAFVFACGTALLLRRMMSKVSFLGKWPTQHTVMSRSELASGLHQ
jgi:uncharacterized membrane protein